MPKITEVVQQSAIKFLAFLVIGALGLGYALSGVIPANATRLASFVSGVVLSYLLLIVYLEIKSSEEIQADQTRKQSEILENQQELQQSLQRLQYEAKVEVERIEGDDDTAELWLSNYGNGSADSLELITEVRLPDDPDLEGGEKPSKTRRIEEHPDSSRSELLGTGASVIGGNERNIRFAANALLLDPLSANEPGAYLRAYHQSVGMKIDSENAEIQLFVEYTDETSEEPVRTPVFQYWLEYNPATHPTLEDILISGSPILDRST